MNNLLSSAGSQRTDLIAGFNPIYVILSEYYAALAALETHPAAPDSEFMRAEPDRLHRAAERELLPFGCPPLGGIFTADQKAGHDAYNAWAAEKTETPAPSLFVAPPGPSIPAAAVDKAAERRAKAAKYQRESYARKKAQKEQSAHADVPHTAPAEAQAKPQSKAAQNPTLAADPVSQRAIPHNDAPNDPAASPILASPIPAKKQADGATLAAAKSVGDLHKGAMIQFAAGGYDIQKHVKSGTLRAVRLGEKPTPDWRPQSRHWMNGLKQWQDAKLNQFGEVAR